MSGQVGQDHTAHAREDDISWVGPPVWKLFRNRSPIALKKDLVIGHVIMSNPFPSPILRNWSLKSLGAQNIGPAISHFREGC